LTKNDIFRVDSIDKLKQKLPQLDQELQDAHKFRDFYNFTFNYARNPTQRTLGTMESCALE
jgi:hypothetical protein